MSKNYDPGAQTFYLTIKRNSQWEPSIESQDADYLKEKGEDWKRLEQIEDYRVDFYRFADLKPVERTRKGAFGIRIDVV